MFEVKEISKNCFEGTCFDDDFVYTGESYEDISDIMESHEREIEKIKEKEQEWLLKGDIRKKLIQLNENIESLIDVAHETYMAMPETDTENRARMDAQIKAYWNVKSMVEDVLSLDH